MTHPSSGRAAGRAVGRLCARGQIRSLLTLAFAAALIFGQTGCPNRDKLPPELEARLSESTATTQGGMADTQFIDYAMDDLALLAEYDASEMYAKISNEVVTLRKEAEDGGGVSPLASVPPSDDTLLQSCPQPELVVQIVNLINQWMHTQSPPDDWRVDPMVESLPQQYRDSPRMKSLDAVKFDVFDGFTLCEATWLRQAAMQAEGNAIDNLDRASRVSDWTARNIQLDGDHSQRVPLFPGETLMLGHGTAVERAWTAVLMLRQLGVPAVVLTLAEPDRTPASPVSDQRSPDASPSESPTTESLSAGEVSRGTTSQTARATLQEATAVGEAPPSAEEGTVEPPVAEPPTAQLPVAEGPTSEPPVARPPVATPLAADPPVAIPPVAEPPVAQPAGPSTMDEVMRAQLRAEQRRAWVLVGALVDGEIYLFDPQLGLPIPAPDGIALEPIETAEVPAAPADGTEEVDASDALDEDSSAQPRSGDEGAQLTSDSAKDEEASANDGPKWGTLKIKPATLAQVQASPEILLQLNLPDLAYPLGAGDFHQLCAHIEASPTYLARRMEQVQGNIKASSDEVGSDRKHVRENLAGLVLSADPSATAEMLRKSEGIVDVALWQYPYATLERRSRLSRLQLIQTLVTRLPLYFSFAEGSPLFRGRLLYLQGNLVGPNSATGAFQQARPSFNTIVAETEHAIDIFNAQLQQLEAAPEHNAKLRASEDFDESQLLPEKTQEEIQEWVWEIINHVGLGLGSSIRRKQDATYWLGLISAEEGNIATANDYFATRIIDPQKIMLPILKSERQPEPDPEFSYFWGVSESYGLVGSDIEPQDRVSRTLVSSWKFGALYNIGRLAERKGQVGIALRAYQFSGRSPTGYGANVRAMWLAREHVKLREQGRVPVE